MPCAPLSFFFLVVVAIGVVFREHNPVGSTPMFFFWTSLQVHRLRAERTLGDLVVGFCKRFGVAEVVPHEERFLAETKFGRDFAAYPVSLPFTLVHTLASVRVCTEGDKEGMRVPNRLSGHTYDVLKVARRLLGEPA